MAGTLNKGSLVKGTGGSGGGSASFPTVVTDSGSSLPAASGYQLNDTFLNTGDKKIYKTVADSYEFDTNAQITTDNVTPVTIDYVTGIASGFYYRFTGSSFQYSYVTKSGLSNNDFGWKEEKQYKVHFKRTSTGTTDTRYMLLGIQIKTGYSSSYFVGIQIINSKLYMNGINASTEQVAPFMLVDYELEVDKEYYVTVHKKSNGKIETIIYKDGYEQTILSSNIVDNPISDVTPYSSNAVTISCGAFPRGTDNSRGEGFNGDIYLLDTTTDYLKPSSSLSWDSGTSITDKTEYADKTNGALYLYENSELVKIGGSLTKKVYTISADNTSTLDVSSDFTKIVDVLKNGVELALTDDYTISSGVITFVTALSTTDKITVKGE